MTIKTKKNIAIACTSAGLFGAFFVGMPYSLAIVLGAGTLIITVFEFQEDPGVAISDLLFTGLFTLGGAQIGVFGMVIGLGIAFASSLVLPGFIAQSLPFLSTKAWKEGRVTPTQKIVLFTLLAIAVISITLIITHQ